MDVTLQNFDNLYREVKEYRANQRFKYGNYIISDLLKRFGLDDVNRLKSFIEYCTNGTVDICDMELLSKIYNTNIINCCLDIDFSSNIHKNLMLALSYLPKEDVTIILYKFYQNKALKDIAKYLSIDYNRINEKLLKIIATLRCSRFLVAYRFNRSDKLIRPYSVYQLYDDSIIPIDDLKLEDRILNALKRSNIRTVKDLYDYIDAICIAKNTDPCKALMGISYIGYKSSNKIIDKIYTIENEQFIRHNNIEHLTKEQIDKKIKLMEDKIKAIQRGCN